MPSDRPTVMSVRAIQGEIVSDDSWLPEPESVRGGKGPYIIPIVDDAYGGVIAWANTKDQAERIVLALNASLQLQTEVVIGIADGEVTGVTGLAPNAVVIVRDWDRGSEPDANGDLYEDTFLEGGVG